MPMRMLLTDFALENPYYAGATVTVYTVDANLDATATKATLYAGPTGATTLANPQVLDSRGKFIAPVYVEVPVVCTVERALSSMTTGVIGLSSRWRGVWQTARVYYPGERVREPSGSSTYVAMAGHTSGTFATDVNDGKLEKEIDGATLAQEVSNLITATRPGTGAVPRSFAQHFASNELHVSDFGAVGDGVADDTAAIQNAINSLDALGGGTVRFDPKPYKHTGLTLAGHNVLLLGAGNGWQTYPFNKGTRLIYAGSSTGNWINVPGDQMGIENMELSASVSLTGGTAISMVRTGDSGSRHSLTRLKIAAPFNAIDIYNFPFCILDHLYILNFAGDFGLRLRGDSANETIYSMFRNVTVDGVTPGASGPAVLIEGNASSHTFLDCYFRNANPGVKITPATDGSRALFTKFFRCEVEANKGEGYDFDGDFVYVTDCYIATNGNTANGGDNSGVRIRAGCRGVVSLQNCDIRVNGRHGVDVEACTARVLIQSCSVVQNSQKAANTYHGINFQGGCKNFLVTGNICGGDTWVNPDAGSFTQRNGITITAGCTNYVVSDNDVRGNANTGIFDGGAGRVGVVRGNWGHTTENSGNVSAVTPDGNGRVTIAHGLDVVPVYANVMLIGNTPTYGVEVYSWDVTNIVARVFDQATGNNVTSGTFTIAWHARGARA